MSPARSPARRSWSNRPALLTVALACWGCTGPLAGAIFTGDERSESELDEARRGELIEPDSAGARQGVASLPLMGSGIARAPAAEPAEDAIEQSTPLPERAPGPMSEPLSCGLYNPMPGGFAAGYAADTGLDIAGMKMPVFAIGAGRVVYAESGHSLWSGRGDTDLAVLIQLDEPIAFEGREVTHVWYAHLIELAFEQPRVSGEKRRRVQAGEYLGINGRANGMWHLHLGLLLDGDTRQGWGTFLLEDDVRKVLCGVRAKQRFPQQPKKK